jgi:hypothetical protein
MPTPRDSSHRWQRLPLIERIAELRLLAQERDDTFAADTARRAALCVEDGELANATIFCIDAEVTLIRHRVRAAHERNH